MHLTVRRASMWGCRTASSRTFDGFQGALFGAGLHRAGYYRSYVKSILMRVKSEFRKEIENFVCDSRTRLHRHYGTEIFLTVPEVVCLGSVEQEKTLCQWATFNLSLKTSAFWNSRIWTCGCICYHQLESRQTISCSSATRT